MKEQTANTSDDLKELQQGIDKLAQEQLAFFREIHKRHEPLSRETLWIHLVHGTWANPEKQKIRPAWYEPGGSLEKALRSHGDPEPWKKVRFAKVPAWSGRNSFRARSQAIQELQEYFRAVLRDPDKTFGRHLVIAHSHGGTVAAEALRGLGPMAREFAGFLTLGTPFVQRVRVFEPPDEVSFETLTGLFAPGVAVFFSLSAAIASLLLALAGATENYYWIAGLWLAYAFIPAIVCRIEKFSIFGWALCSVTPPLVVVVAFFWLVIGGHHWGEFLTASFLAAFITPFLGVHKLVPRRAVHFLDESDADSEEQLPRPIQVPLLAIRAPGDEASLAISAAAGALFVSDTIRGLGSRVYRWFPKWAGIGISCLVLAGAILMFCPVGKYLRLAGAIALIGPYAATLLALIVMLALKFTAVTLIAIACGWEAFEAPGLIRVYAEPLPRSSEPLECCPMTLRMTFPTAEDLKLMQKQYGLRHSIYEYPSVQKYLAAWILSFVPKSSN